MKLLIKFGLVIDLVTLIASFILGNFVYTAFELHKFIEVNYHYCFYFTYL